MNTNLSARKPAPDYRADIDGLRAVAVLPVLLFHLEIAGFSGGFIGVDVFLVVSGYLITRLIQSDIARNTFTITNFYLRRIRRLAPTLIVVVLATTVAASLVLYPEDMRSFASSLTVQFLSLQNMIFLQEGEYFRGAATKPLLHTWSLAVEEQFYLLWPAGLLLIKRFRFRSQLGLVLLAVVGSFALNILLMRVSPKASFFLLPSRAWELGIGCCIALLEAQGFFARILKPRLRTVAGFVGLAAILGSIVALNSDTPFPGWAALVPVGGAALIIIAGTGGTHPVGRVLSLPPLVHIGLRSYALYLWHWPLIVMSRHLGFNPSAAPVAALLIVAAFLLAELTYRFIEAPIRHRQLLRTTKPLLVFSGASAVAFTAFAAHAFVTDGAAWRFTPAVRPFLTAPFTASRDRCGFIFRITHPSAQVCALHTEPKPEQRILLWGNSHANMWAPLLVSLASEYRANLYLNARNCRPTKDSDFCGKSVQDSVFAFIASEQITDVVLASSWFGVYNTPDDVFERSLGDVVREISARGAQTWLVVDIPNAPQLSPLEAYKSNPLAPQFGQVPIQEYDRTRRKERALFASYARTNRLVDMIDPSNAFCGSVSCTSGRGQEIWYGDSNHLTFAGAWTARDQFVPVFTVSRVVGQGSR